MVLTLEHKKIVRRNVHSKLDNAIVTNLETLNELNKHAEEQMTQTTLMHLHTRLEFVKMTIHTKNIDISLRLRKKDNNILKNLNDQINKSIKLRKKYTYENSLYKFTTGLERCKQERDMILQNQGGNASMKTKTRCYNKERKIK